MPALSTQVEAAEGQNERKIGIGHNRPPSFSVKIYLVFLPKNLTKHGEPNVEVIGCFLTREKADQLHASYPGSYVLKAFATK